MKREIKFRGKRVDNGKWVYGHIVQEAGSDDVYIVSASIVIWNKYKVIPESLGEFTGLKDKNGKEIYEGDIVRCISNNGDKGNMVVIFEEGEFRKVLCEKYKSYTTGFGYYAIRLFNQEVIGNIHENPELLK